MLIRAVPSAGLPQLRTSDGSAVSTWGPETAYTGGIALAASWDTALARSVGESMRADARAEGVHILLASLVLTSREPPWTAGTSSILDRIPVWPLAWPCLLSRESKAQGAAATV